MAQNKIGRNTPCPCGSGRKFKKCCIYKNHQIQPNAVKIIYEGRNARIAAMKKIAEETAFTCRQRDDWKTAKFEAEKVNIVIEEIECTAKKILTASNHSRQYWFVLIRRYSDLLWEELKISTGNNELPGVANPVPKLAGKLTLLATGNEEPHEWIELDGQRGINYAALGQQEMLTIAKIFSLAATWADAETKYRFACKGFQVFSTSLEKNALDLQNTTSIELYESRRNELGTLSGSAGLWYDPVEFAAIDSELCLWFGVASIPEDTLYLQSKNPTANIPLKFFISPVSEYYARERNQDFERKIAFDRLILDKDLRAAFEKGFSVDPQDLVTFLYCVSRFIYSMLRLRRLDYGNPIISIHWQDEGIPFRQKILHHWKDVASLGMLRSSKSAWVEALLYEVEGIQEYNSAIPCISRAKMSAFVDQFTWSHGDSVSDNDPRLFIRLSSKTLALDTTWLVDFLRHILIRAGITSRESNEMSDVTGPWFEVQARSFFVRELSLSDSKLIFQRNIKDREGREEIDIAFVFKRCLFVIDCKAMSKTSGYMAGHHSLLRNRKTEQLKQLRKRNPARIRKIKAGLVRDKIKPEDFDTAYGLVCTTDVEYLLLEEPDFWIHKHPCVGPPDELLATIKAIT